VSAPMKPCPPAPLREIKDGVDFAANEIAHGLRELLEGFQIHYGSPQQQDERRRMGAERIRAGLREAIETILTGFRS